MYDAVVLVVWRATKPAMSHQCEHGLVVSQNVAVQPTQTGVGCRGRQSVHGTLTQSAALPAVVDRYGIFSAVARPLWVNEVAGLGDNLLLVVAPRGHHECDVALVVDTAIWSSWAAERLLTAP